MERMTFGQFITEARKKVNITQKNLAERLAISAQYLNDIERDRRNPSSDHIVQQFANALGLNADYLHYLNGRFPEQEREQKLTEEQFRRKILAFRKTSNSPPLP
jgi:transcriptional regulator with XRE-family HTH domain